MSRSTIGIDIGGTKMRVLVMDGVRVAQSREMPTPRSQKQFIKLLGALIESAPRRARDNIGVGVAGVVRKTTVIYCPNIPYLRNFDLKIYLPVAARLIIDNDARCFARCECQLGSGKSFNSVFALTIGTGIGRAYAEQGNVMEMKKFEHPEPWEKEYQRVRDSGNNDRLASYLAEKIFRLIKHFHASTLIIGGGVAARKNLVSLLTQNLKKIGVDVPVLRPRFGKNSVAIGAALNL